ncbi:MAG: hypothetical protein IJ545_08080 [Alphaproteobacteria bacterium]|nr:hypothetical protein [Alphaproteobacteria bacterium]
MRTTITNRMMIGASLLVMTFSFTINVKAQSCTKVPTCEELGYTGTSCSSGVATLKCPFDQSKVFCAEDCSSYTLDSCPSHALCEQCSNGKYKRTGCEDGYISENQVITSSSSSPTSSSNVVLVNNLNFESFLTPYLSATSDSDVTANCVVNPCDGYTLSAPVAHCSSSSYNSCKSGNTTKYRCTACESGYIVSKYAMQGGKRTSYIESCTVNPCYFTNSYFIDETTGNVTYHGGAGNTEKYKLTSKSDPHCVNQDTYSSCQSGSTMLYYCHSCISGYTSLSYQYTYSTTAGLCFTYNNYDSGYCPSSKGWSTSKDSNANSFEGCYKYSGPNSHTGTQYWRPTACKDGYKINYDTMRCVPK